MLPWIFVVLVLLNAGVFLWGYQREKALEPLRTPVPAGSYEIRLLGEEPLTAESRQPESDGKDVLSQPATGSSEEGPGGLSPDELEADGPAVRAEGFVTPPPDPSKAE